MDFSSCCFGPGRHFDFSNVFYPNLLPESYQFNYQCSERYLHLDFSFFECIDFFQTSVSSRFSVSPYNFMKCHSVTRSFYWPGFMINA